MTIVARMTSPKGAKLCVRMFDEYRFEVFWDGGMMEDGKSMHTFHRLDLALHDAADEFYDLYLEEERSNENR